MADNPNWDGENSASIDSRGHKPDIFSDVDWENYLDRLEYDAGGVARMIMDGAVAQLGERGLCKPEVRGSIPLSSTTS